MITPEYWLLVLLSSARITTFLFVVPFFRNNGIPILAKTTVALSLSMFVAAQLEPVNIESLAELFGLFLIEIAIGFILAFMIEMIFAIVAIAGSFIDMDIGLMNPFIDLSTNTQSTPLSRIFHYVFLMVFLVVGGLEKTITGFIYTFELNVRAFFDNKQFIDFFLETFNVMFFGALQIALPFIISTFLIYVAMLLMSKTIDKINILMNIFGIKIFAGLMLIFLSIPVLMIVFEQINETVIDHFYRLIEIMFAK